MPNDLFEDLKPRPVSRRQRLEFESEEEALSYRKLEGCGGWVLGRFLYVGEWTPTRVFMDPGMVGSVLK